VSLPVTPLQLRIRAQLSGGYFIDVLQRSEQWPDMAPVWHVAAWRMTLLGAKWKAWRMQRRFQRFNGEVIIAVLAVFLLSASAQAQEPKPNTFTNLAPYIFMASGNAADLWTTHEALASGHAYERNPLLSQDIGKIAAVKIASTVATAVMMHVMDKLGHPKIAKTLGYAAGSVTWGVAAHNHGVAR